MMKSVVCALFLTLLLTVETIAFEPTGQGPRHRPSTVDIETCHACAAVSQEFCEESMHHQQYLEQQLGIERKSAAQLEKEAVARGDYGTPGSEDQIKSTALGSKYKTNEQVLEDLALGVCEDFRLMKYDHFKVEIERGTGKKMMLACEHFIRDQSEQLVDFFGRYHLMEIPCVRGVDIYCNDYVDVCRNFDITIVKLPSGKQAAVYVKLGQQPLGGLGAGDSDDAVMDDNMLSTHERQMKKIDTMMDDGIFVEGAQLPTETLEAMAEREALERQERENALRQPHQAEDTRPLKGGRGLNAEEEIKQQQAQPPKVDLPEDVQKKIKESSNVKQEKQVPSSSTATGENEDRDIKEREAELEATIDDDKKNPEGGQQQKGEKGQRVDYEDELSDSSEEDF